MAIPRRSLSRISKSKPALRCQFSFSDGRYCRMPRAADHPEYCVHHSREDRQLLEAERIGELLAATPSGEFLTATDVNSVLGKLYTAIAQNRIPPRNAALMAYIGQLLLQSTRAIKDEIMNAQGYTTWCKVSKRALTEKLPQPPSSQKLIVSPEEPSAPPIDPSLSNPEYEAKNDESRLLEDLKAATQVFIPRKL